MADEILAEASTTATNTPDPRDTWEKLTAKLAQLQALLAMTCDDAQESFQNMNNELQNNYMLACMQMAADCSMLVDSMGSVVYRPCEQIRARVEEAL
jgi:hypothetical protein